MVFLDNHDTQRKRWRDAHEAGNPPPDSACHWDGIGIGNCRPIYKHGQDYLQAMIYMLTYPYGDAVRLMSSFYFHGEKHGPPSVNGETVSVWEKGDAGEYPTRCRWTPDSSPVQWDYDLN